MPAEKRIVDGPAEVASLMARARIIAVFAQVGDDFGLMVNSDQRLTRAEKALLLEAAQSLETRD